MTFADYVLFLFRWASRGERRQPWSCQSSGIAPAMDSSWAMRYGALWVFSYCLLELSSGFPQQGRERKSDRTVVFPDSNSTEHHSLPVFPDPVVDFVGQKLPLAPAVDKFGHPLCASKPDDTFCESVDNYPDKDIRKAITYSSEQFKELFGTMTIHSRKMAPGDPSEETVCTQQSRLFYPKAAMNENDQWAYVVNDIDYVQAVMAEMCEKEDKPCHYLDGALPAGVSSRCKQKFAYKRMLALHPSNKKTYTDSFRFPSCCVCYVTRPFVLSRTRMAKETDDYREP